MKILVVIPSKARPDNIRKYILPFMSRLNLDYRIFVEPQDEQYYDFKHVITLPKNNKGLGYSLVFAKKYTLKHGYDLIFKVDDDVKSVGAIENDMGRILKAFKLPNIAAVCFPYSFEFYAKTDKLFTRINKRVQTSYIIRTDVFNPDERISTFEDFYQFLNIINKGLNTIYCSKHLIDCGAVGKGKGGLQSFDRSKMAELEINKFKAIDPTITTISKPEKTWKHEPKFTAKKYKSRAI